MRGQSSWSSQYLGIAAILVRGRSILMTAMDTTVPSQNDLQKLSNKYLTRYKNVGSQGPQVMILDHFYTIHQMYRPQIFVFSEKCEDIHFMINTSAHEFLTI